MEKIKGTIKGVDELEVIADTGKKVHHSAAYVRRAEFRADTQPAAM